MAIGRRLVLTGIGASAFALATGRALADEIAFNDLYASVSVLGLAFSDKVKSLAGRDVSMTGFMAPPLKAESNFFVLTEVPMALCPFCSSDADWPDNIVVVYLNQPQTFEQANGLIRVSGRLEIGSWTDPQTGFVSLLRIVGADVGRV